MTSCFSPCTIGLFTYDIAEKSFIFICASRTVNGISFAFHSKNNLGICGINGRNFSTSHMFATTVFGLPSYTILPLFIQITRVASGITSSKRCSLKTIVIPSSSLIRFNNPKNSFAAIGSNCAVGSSNNNNFGCITNTAAKLTSCFCPPDNV
ncbi:hypothetical protein BN2127_JRS10_04232 [Bacillus subtilis]|nr:hypothetical protein BN2127_JRS10_04232 [Bacillus subtilis]